MGEHLVEALGPAEALVPRIAEGDGLLVVEHRRRAVGDAHTVDDGGGGKLDVLGEQVPLPAAGGLQDVGGDEEALSLIHIYSSAYIDISTKTDNPGIDIRIADGTKGETVYIPVIVTKSGLKDVVYNTFYVGENCDITIIAGCGIHNDSHDASEHDGIHSFYLGKNSRVRYVEKHYGEGDGSGERILNPTTNVYMEEGSSCEMEMVQLRGVTSTVRDTNAELGADAKMCIRDSSWGFAMEACILSALGRPIIADEGRPAPLLHQFCIRAGRRRRPAPFQDAPEPCALGAPRPEDRRR